MVEYGIRYCAGRKVIAPSCHHQGLFRMGFQGIVAFKGTFHCVGKHHHDTTNEEGRVDTAACKKKAAGVFAHRALQTKGHQCHASFH